MTTEFDIISNYFKSLGKMEDPVKLGIGDDAAVVSVPSECELAITVDTLVEGVHFFHHTSPETLAHKALAVNLSDLAAMGAKPSWITLALTLPRADESWLHAFSETLKKLLDFYQVQLIGGDLTHGPLTISIQAAGLLPKNQRLTRKGAKKGDLVFVSGTLGDAALAFKLLKSNQLDSKNLQHQYLLSRLERPVPRVELGQQLLSIASSCIDISDGLVADLGHILQQSYIGAEIEIERIPMSPAFLNCVENHDKFDLALGFGDDYELCFTVPAENNENLKPYIDKNLIRQIGKIVENKELILLDSKGKKVFLETSGYKHF